MRLHADGIRLNPPRRPGTASAQTRITLDQFLTLPETKPAREYIPGRVTRKAWPNGPHGTLQTWVAELLDDQARARRIGTAFIETRVTCAGRSLVPDIIFYSWDRIPRATDSRVAEDFTTVPDAVIEILSPGQRLNALSRRCHWYVVNGARLALLVDPRHERVLLFRPASEAVMIAGDEAIDLGELLPDFVLSARQLFDALYFR